SYSTACQSKSSSVLQSPRPCFLRSTNLPIKNATIPTPIPVCIQKSRLSTSPGSSPPRIRSRTGVAQASYPESTSSSTTPPASSEPPNSASFRRNSGINAISITAAINAITVPFFILPFLLQKTCRPEFRSGVCLKRRNDQHRQNSLDNRQRDLGRRKNSKELG